MARRIHVSLLLRLCAARRGRNGDGYTCHCHTRDHPRHIMISPFIIQLAETNLELLIESAMLSQTIYNLHCTITGQRSLNNFSTMCTNWLDHSSALFRFHLFATFAPTSDLNKEESLLKLISLECAFLFFFFFPLLQTSSSCATPS